MDIIIYILLVLGGLFCFVFAFVFIFNSNKNESCDEDIATPVILFSIGIWLYVLASAKFKSDVETDTIIKMLNKDIAVDTIATNPYNGRITEVKILE